MGNGALSDWLAIDDDERRIRQEVEEDVADSLGLTMEDRARRLEAVCHSAWAILRARPDFERTMEWRDPLPADFDDIWQRLRDRYLTQQTGTQGSSEDT